MRKKNIFIIKWFMNLLWCWNFTLTITVNMLPAKVLNTANNLFTARQNIYSVCRMNKKKSHLKILRDIMEMTTTTEKILSRIENKRKTQKCYHIIKTRAKKANMGTHSRIVLLYFIITSLCKAVLLSNYFNKCWAKFKWTNRNDPKLKVKWNLFKLLKFNWIYLLT